MGKTISDIINVTITRESARVLQRGFGIPMIFGEHSHFEDKVREYDNPDDMLTDGFLVTDAHYLAAIALMAQRVSPSTFKVGRKLADVNEIQIITFTGTPSAGTFTITLDAVTSGAINWDDDAAAVETALELMANIASVSVTGDFAVGFTVEFDGADANTAFNTFTIDVSSLTGVTASVSTVLQEGSAVESWTVGLAALRNVGNGGDDDWYGLGILSNADQDIEDISDAVEALSTPKLFVFASAEADIIATPTTDIISVLSAKNYDRTAAIYHTQAGTEYPEFAWMGLQLPKDPGSTTWANKTLVGITADEITTTADTNITNKNGNSYQEVGGVSIMLDGRVVSGEWIDVIRGTDWLQARIEERVFSTLVNAEKIPFTDPGVGVIMADIEAQLQEGVEVNFLVAGSAVVTAPKVADISPANKTARTLPDVEFSAGLAGAIHKATIQGKLFV